ncbi:hypothetical protein ACHAXA_002656 [Cyclostephanos tholiformis]|uniref:DUF6824 domain-containing protein n=1 Tax=Cyclostephanos tholiformis TaxID=382380 RepID=A0ABD3SD64_9STRA
MKTKDIPLPPIPPGTEAMLRAKCRDVVMGRGSGTQNHCGNVAYRKIVYLNKELYVTSSKFDKLKISKAIVAAIRHFGGNFIQADERRGGLYFDIGDKRAWDKTSQALREGQAEIRGKLAEDDPAGMRKIAEYKQVISEQAFFAYACKIMASLFYSAGESGEYGISACGPDCPYAKRRQTLHQLGANPRQIFNAMCSMAAPPHPPPHVTPQQPRHQVYDQPYNSGDSSAYNNHITPSSSMLCEPPAFNAPISEGGIESLDPLPFKPQHESLEPLPLTNLNVMELSLEPIPHQMENHSVQLNSSISSLNHILNNLDYEASSDEGKELMSALNQEVDDLIRRKSYGLIQIDTKYAFEDLMFEEDCEMPESVNNETVSNYAATTPKPDSGSFGYSMLSAKDDVSLMNMSLLSLDDHSGSENPNNTNDGGPRKSIIASAATKRKGSRVNWLMEQHSSSTIMSSIMSLDNRSFSDLVECIKDPDANQEEENNKLTSESSISSHSQGSISRRMGFPIRRSVAGKLTGANISTGIRQEEFVASSENVSAVSTSLTIPEDLVIKSDKHFTELAGQVQNPFGDSRHTLKNMSQYNMSSMTLSMPSMGASFIDLLDEDDK